MRRRRSKLTPLISLLRLMLVALALQLSGSAPALARVVDVVRSEIAPHHACACCVAMAARERAERIRDQGRAVVKDADSGCCNGAQGGGCGDSCATCGAVQSAKSFTNEPPLVVALAEPVARIAAHSPAPRAPSSAHPPNIFRPPCG